MDTVWAIKRPDPFRNRAFCFRFHKAFTAFHHVSMVDSQVYLAVCNGFSCVGITSRFHDAAAHSVTLAITMVSPVFTSCFHDVIHSVSHCISLKQFYFTAYWKSALLGKSLEHDLSEGWSCMKLSFPCTCEISTQPIFSSAANFPKLKVFHDFVC